MSYHNGSVWPHDNGVAAMGLARAGNSAGVLKILDGLFATAVQLRTGSLPELFCGFKRESNLAPVPYPVACHPQAWSAASVFMILQALLGIEVRGFERQLVIDKPMLPPWLDWLRVEDLQVGEWSSVSFLAPEDGHLKIDNNGRRTLSSEPPSGCFGCSRYFVS